MALHKSLSFLPPATQFRVCGAGGCGVPWLQVEFVQNSGTALQATVNGNTGQMTAYLRVIGGTAAALFNSDFWRRQHISL